MDKSPEAFRTISEVADLLETPAHVLRFWESRFPQIRPVKRAGGRRYYRPADVALLAGIKRLLHDEGLTIRGVQKMLREQGVRHVAGMGGDAHVIEEDAEAALEAALSVNFPDEAEVLPEPAEAETAQIVALETALRKGPVRPNRPVQENLFSGLFDDLQMVPTPEPEPEPQAPAAAAAAPAYDEAPEEVPEAPMMLDAEEEEETTILAAVLAGPAPTLPPAATESDTAAADDSSPDVPDAPTLAAPQPTGLAARLAALPRARRIAHRETLRALRDRLVALEDRMIGPRY